MSNQFHEYTINIDSERLRDRLKAMKEEGLFEKYFNKGFGGNYAFWVKQDSAEGVPGYTTRYILKPQEGSVLIKIHNEFTKEEIPSAPFLGWQEIRRDLERSGYDIRDVTGFELTAVFEHSYIDPGTIRNPNHRKVIRALIEAELSPDRIQQKDIATQFKYAESRISEIKKLYLRPEFRDQE